MPNRISSALMIVGVLVLTAAPATAQRGRRGVVVVAPPGPRGGVVVAPGPRGGVVVEPRRGGVVVEPRRGVVVVAPPPRAPVVVAPPPRAPVVVVPPPRAPDNPVRCCPLETEQAHCKVWCSRCRLDFVVVGSARPHRGVTPKRRAWDGGAFDPSWSAAEAVDSDFAEALRGEEPQREWHTADERGVPVRWEWPWQKSSSDRIEVVHQASPAEHLRTPWIAPA